MFDMKWFLGSSCVAFLTFYLFGNHAVRPELFYKFAKRLWPGFGSGGSSSIKYFPTPTHYFIRALESKNKLLRAYTQNIDTLECRAGIKKVITCHGSFVSASCQSCEFQISGASLRIWKRPAPHVIIKTIPGVEIEQHIMTNNIPLCPHCHPQRSDLKHTRRGQKTQTEEKEEVDTSASQSPIRRYKESVPLMMQCKSGEETTTRIRFPMLLTNLLKSSCDMAVFFIPPTFSTVVDGTIPHFALIVPSTTVEKVGGIKKTAILSWKNMTIRL